MIAITIPLIFALVVAAISITMRGRGAAEPPPPDTGPLAVVPVDAPDAAGPDCKALLAALPTDLAAAGGTLHQRPLADPAPPGVRAWAAAPQPVVLRCGLPRPVELTPTAALLEVNGVRWLTLDDGAPNPDVATYVAVDRPVYVVLTAPLDAGSGPIQQVSDLVRNAMPATEVKVR